MKSAKSIFTLITICWTAAAWSYDFRPTPLDFLFAQDYCKAKFSDPQLAHLAGDHVRYPKKLRQSWMRMIGGDYQHMHHYCKGAAVLSRAQMPSERRKAGQSAASYFSLAISEIQYTRDNSKPGSLLWIPMTIDLARAYEGSGNRSQAIKLLLELRETSGRAPEVHVALARTLSRANKVEDAIQVLEQANGNFQNNGSILFYLAHFYYDAGDLAQAGKYSKAAQAAGMKMDSLNELLPRDLTD